MNARFEDLPPEGCHRCSTPMSDIDPGLPSPVLTDTGMAYVLLCPDCAGINPEDVVIDLDPAYDAPPADLNACCRCNGTGGVQVEWNYWTGAEFDVCRECNGTGQRIPLGGAA